MLPDIKRGRVILRTRQVTKRLLMPLSASLRSQFDDATWRQPLAKFDTRNALLNFHPFFQHDVQNRLPSLVTGQIDSVVDGGIDREIDSNAAMYQSGKTTVGANAPNAGSQQGSEATGWKQSGVVATSQFEHENSLFKRLKSMVDELQSNALNHQSGYTMNQHHANELPHLQSKKRIEEWETQQASSERKRVIATSTGKKNKTSNRTKAANEDHENTSLQTQYSAGGQNRFAVRASSDTAHGVKRATTNDGTLSNLSNLVTELDGHQTKPSTKTVDTRVEPRQRPPMVDDNGINKGAAKATAKARLYELTDALTPVTSLGQSHKSKTHAVLLNEDGVTRTSNQVDQHIGPESRTFSCGAERPNTNRATKPLLSDTQLDLSLLNEGSVATLDALEETKSWTPLSAAAHNHRGPSAASGFLNLPRRLSPDVTETVADALNEYLQEQAMLHGVDIL